MNHVLFGALVFVAAYLLNIFYITVLYHRGLAHGAVTLRPWTRKWVIATGNWVTGMDPKAWCCMHRLHHIHSDTLEDPHSPVHRGIFSVMLAQLRSYEAALRSLKHDRDPHSAVAKDLDFPVNWMNRHRVWFLPYVLHAGIAVGIGFLLASPWVGACYWLGMMSHPIQGWMVNALAHKYGYRNFETTDNSRNNSFVALLVFGEGYQNNHHHYPRSAKFSFLSRELDLGFLLCRTAQSLLLLDIPGSGQPETNQKMVS